MNFSKLMGRWGLTLHAIAMVWTIALSFLAVQRGAHAETPAAAGSIDAEIRSLIERDAGGNGRRLEIAIGQPDSRLTPAPCPKIEAFLPAGTRAWGRVNVGLRCKNGAAWTVFLPVTVKVYGKALAATKSLMSGTLPTDNEVELVETELSRDPGTPVTELPQIAGRILARALFPGQVLRLEQFRAAPVIGQGDQVKLVARGPGFSISADGEALAHALEGQSVRVKTDSGRVVSGTARQGRVVELRF